MGKWYTPPAEGVVRACEAGCECVMTWLHGRGNVEMEEALVPQQKKFGKGRERRAFSLHTNELNLYGVWCGNMATLSVLHSLEIDRIDLVTRRNSGLTGNRLYAGTVVIRSTFTRQSRCELILLHVAIQGDGTSSSRLCSMEKYLVNVTLPYPTMPFSRNTCF